MLAIMHVSESNNAHAYLLTPRISNNVFVESNTSKHCHQLTISQAISRPLAKSSARHKQDHQQDHRHGYSLYRNHSHQLQIAGIANIIAMLLMTSLTTSFSIRLSIFRLSLLLFIESTNLIVKLVHYLLTRPAESFKYGKVLISRLHR